MACAQICCCHQWAHIPIGYRAAFFSATSSRQFIVADSDGDEGFRQLALTCFFQPSPAFDALKSGNRWHRSAEDLAGFEAFIRASSAYQAVGTLKPHKITIEYGGV